MRIGKLCYAGMALTSVVMLAGCDGGAGAAATDKLEQISITVDSVPAAEEGGLYVAAAQGYFAQQGLHVTIRTITGGEAGIPDLQSGKAELVDGNYVSFILAQMTGKFDHKPVAMRIIAASSELRPGSEALYVMPDSRIRTVSDLVKFRATVGFNTPNDVGEMLMGATLAQNGAALKDIKLVIPPGGFPPLIGMLAKRGIDAIWLPQPLGEIAEQQIGAIPLVDFDSGQMQNLPFTGVIGSSAWVQTHPNTVAAFLRALQEGQQLADSDRGAVEAAMEQFTGVPPIIADTMAIDGFPLQMDIPQLQRVADAMFQFGLTRRPYHIAAMIQPEPGTILK
jgi:NitT/TauT family transport system substrate-binding protein